MKRPGHRIGADSAKALCSMTAGQMMEKSFYGIMDALSHADVKVNTFKLSFRVMSESKITESDQRQLVHENVTNALNAMESIQKNAAKMFDMPENTRVLKFLSVKTRYAGHGTTEVIADCAGFTDENGVPLIERFMEAASPYLRPNGYAGNILASDDVEKSGENYGLGNAARSLTACRKRLQARDVPLLDESLAAAAPDKNEGMEL